MLAKILPSKEGRSVLLKVVGCTYILLIFCSFVNFSLATPTSTPPKLFNISSLELIDRNGDLSPTEILNRLDQFNKHQMKPYKYSDDVHWFLVTLESNQIIKSKSFAIILDIFGISSLNIYSIDDGRLIPQDHMRIRNQRPSFLVNYRPNEPIRLLFRVRFADVYEWKIDVKESHQELISNQTNGLLGSGLFLGFSCAMFLYISYLYVSIREPVYIFYAMFIPIFSALISGLNGSLAILGFTDAYTKWIAILATFVLVSGGIFTTSFLETKRHLPKLDFILKFCALACLICSVLLILDTTRKVQYAIDFIGAIMCLLWVMISIQSIRKKVPGALTFTLAWSTLIIFAILWSASLAGVAPKFLLTGDYLSLGNVIQTTIISFGLGQRFRQAINKYETFLQNANEELEKKAIERTKIIETQQAALIESSKLSSIGKMSGGVAHEINNPMMIISGYVELMMKMIESREIDVKKILEICKKVLASTERINHIVGILRSIGEKDRPENMHIYSINSIVHEACHLWLNNLGDLDLQHTLELLDLDTQVHCNSSMISQVLVNLLNNAYDAISQMEHRWIKVQLRRRDLQVEISITDAGRALSEKISQKVFDPFYTTKPVGQGTGLGLAISKSTIDAHQGTIYYDLNSSHSKFIILLPIYEHEVKESA